MSKKFVVLPVIMLLLAAFVFSGCSKYGEKTEESAAQTQETTEQTQATKEQTSPAAKPQETEKKLSWDNPPEMEIDTKKSYEAEFTTSKGNFKIELFAKDAPKTVNNFVFLARQGFYNDVIFHRIIQSFMIQTGDPEGTGAGGPGYQFEDEKTNYAYEPGIVAMANAGPNTNGSQFFICTGDDSRTLKPDYTIFGKVTEGMDVVNKIAATPVEANPYTGEPSSPTETVTITEIKIVEK
ncbi:MULTISPECIES: peptidylprolyl isomerase [Paenibacillus]|uniref:peptidylprolyl isomerase n=1 Tax=Paenibacillus TaxID=44249 RepID=UPI002FDFCA10